MPCSDVTIEPSVERFPGAWGAGLATLFRLGLLGLTVPFFPACGLALTLVVFLCRLVWRECVRLWCRAWLPVVVTWLRMVWLAAVAGAAPSPTQISRTATARMTRRILVVLMIFIPCRARSEHLRGVLRHTERIRHPSPSPLRPHLQVMLTTWEVSLRWVLPELTKRVSEMLY